MDSRRCPSKTVSQTGVPNFHVCIVRKSKTMDQTDVEHLTGVSREPTPQVEWYRESSKFDGAQHPRFELRSIRSDNPSTMLSIQAFEDVELDL